MDQKTALGLAADLIEHALSTSGISARVTGGECLPQPGRVVFNVETRELENYMQRALAPLGNAALSFQVAVILRDW